MAEYITTTVKALKSYPTYQFYAKADSDKVTLDNAFKICILEAFRWVRSRLRNFADLPEELNSPEPDEFESFTENRLTSFSFNKGFQIDVIYIDTIGSWSFRITEPDMGANHGKPQERQAVNGRTFTTEIAFLKCEKYVEIGVRTICSEPEDATADCEVFRPRLVRALTENTNIRLHHSKLIIDGSPIEVKSKADLERLFSVIQDPDRGIPVILVADSASEAPETPQPIELNAESVVPIDSYKLSGFKKKDHSISVNINIEGVSAKKDAKIIDEKPKKEKAKKPTGKPKAVPVRTKLPVFDYTELSKKLVAFAIVVFVDEKYYGAVDKKVHIPIQNGDIILITRQMTSERFAYSSLEDMQSVFDDVHKAVVGMMKRSSFSFGKVLFYSDAKLKDYRTKRHQTDSLEEKCRIYKLENAELKEQIKVLSQQQNDHSQVSDSLRIAKKRIETLNAELEAKEQAYNKLMTEVSLKESAYRKSAERIGFYKDMIDIAAMFPTDKNAVCDWIEENYSDLMTVAPRVQSEMRKYSGYLDLVSLCDGIVFLFAYARYRRKEISEEVLALYAERKNWEIQGSGKEALKMYRTDYTVTINGEKHLLDQHIKQGIHAEELLRIYFCWDCSTKKIIIGSMPGHLPTVKNST